MRLSVSRRARSAGAARLLLLLAVVACAPAVRRDAAPPSPEQAARALLDADRAFGAAAADVDLPTALARTFADSVLMLAPGGSVARGRDAAVAALRASPASATARLTWAPIRAGISADGAHGFTIGYVTTTRADGTAQPGKYVAYWERGADGWRVRAYKRIGRPAGDVSTALRAPSLPARLDPALAAAPADVAGYAAELAETERAFAREGRAGLPAAFARYATPDADHSGGPADAEFVHGPAAVARSLAAGGDGPTDIAWAPEHTIVARSGDLGANVGFIEAGGRRIPFLSIWRRAGPGAPWRWIAE